MTVAAEETMATPHGRAVVDWSRSNIPVVLALAIAVAGAALVPQFATGDNAIDILRSQSFLGVAAVGMTFVVLAGRFVDLSMPAVIAVAGNLALAQQTHGWVAAAAIALAVGFLIGVANGSAVAFLRINPVIATLGVGSIASGLLLHATGGALSRAHSSGLGDLISGSIAGIPSTVIVFLTLVVVAQLALTYTRFGSYLRLSGANEEAAAATGVPTRAITVTAFCCAGLAAALTGCMIAGFAGQADLTIGTGYEFDALIAVVIGGTPLAGGRGGFLRTLVGVLIVGMLNNIMLLEGLATSWQLLVKGCVFIAIVLADRFFARAEA